MVTVPFVMVSTTVASVWSGEEWLQFPFGGPACCQ
jgi:hypothetical protein